MQIVNLNKIIFLLLFFFIASQPANSQLDKTSIEQADQLFKNNHLLEAEKIYLKNLNLNQINSFETEKKLAFISKEKNDWLMELYYLSSMHEKQTELSTSYRLEEIAKKRNLSGYEVGIVERIRWFYFEFFPYILGILLLPAIYVAYALVIKKVQKEIIPAYQIIYYILYVGILFVICNIPNFFWQGLTSSNKTYMRNFASSSAPVIKTLQKGTRINFIYKTNEWIPCYLDGSIGYIKTKDVLIIN
jgi:uncharacterized protein YgiM (DUF1202 family)